MPQTLVDAEQHDHVLVVSMQREQKRNAVDRAMADALDEAFNRLDDDPNLWVGILTGTPAIFSAGSDLTAGGDYVTERGGEYGLIRRERRKPLIAAVEGPALGGGMEMVLACDLVVASTTASFGLPEVAIGALPSSGGLFRGPQVLPLNLARELVLTGEPIDVDRAHAAGFVNVVAAPSEALSAALELAERICKNAPLSVQSCLRAINEAARRFDAEGWAATTEAGRSLVDTADMQEGIRAFLEKRPPRWTGR
ncbi:MAG: enoyl-CoA hydratase/isomerase family protein [Acidimicrobiia bacterium]|nr:enoyl-CoA hydratase/isomerase family protein [Acidimicrobiia bacterium]